MNERVTDLFVREGADSWYDARRADLPAGTKCAEMRRPQLPQGDGHPRRLVRVRLSHAAVLGASRAAVARRPLSRRRRPISRLVPVFPALRHRIARQCPFRSVVTAGWTLDDQGRAQSKSIGNTVDPVEVAKKLGGEIIRLWVASVDFREDVVGTRAMMERDIAGNYRKIRNTFRNMLANLYDFEPRATPSPSTTWSPRSLHARARCRVRPRSSRLV